MSVFELYFKTDKTIDELAEAISTILGAAAPQERVGDNRGGRYVQIEVFGLTLELLKNMGEVSIPERADWPYYLLIYSAVVPLDQSMLKTLADYAAMLIRHEGLACEVDSLS
jgi:hypothetical protein